MLRLLPHPSAHSSAVRSIEVALGRMKGGYRLWYFLIGDIDALVVPEVVAQPERTDDLWKSTCFEAFVKGDGKGYCEFNFSPSRHWAAYAFSNYREGQHDMPTAVTLHTSRLENLLCVEAQINADFGHNSRLCLAAVVEEKGGTVTHWALEHPGDTPDFHDEACFAMRLADIA